MSNVVLAIGVVVLGAVGALGRFGLGRWGNATSGGWPIGTLVANVVAAFLLGAIHGHFGDLGTAIGVGFLGALSTWSTLAVEIVDRLRSGRWPTAIGYAGVTLLAGIAAAWAGLQL